MFTTGFTMNAKEIAESTTGETTLWLKALAKSKNCAIAGSIVVEETGNYYNRLLFVFPSGEIKTYDKRHLFTLAGEDKIYTAGNNKTIVDYNGFRICTQICYDLRFPVFSRNTEGYDVLLYVANWPNARINAWDSLLKARAIENQCFVIGVNRIGEDNNHHSYNGHSQIVDFYGNYLLEPKESEGFFIVDLNKKEMLAAREKFNFLSDRDLFTLSE
jgi:predicted amidohydrolase